MNDDSGPLVSPFSANQVDQVDTSHWQRELFGQDPNQELVPLLTSSSFSATHQDPYTQHRQSQTDREARPLAPEPAMPSHILSDAGREARMSLVEDQDPTRGLPIGPRPSGGIQGFAFHRSHSSIDNPNLMPHSNPALRPMGPSALSDTTGPSPNSTSALEKCTSWSMPNDNIPRSIGAPDSQEGSFGEPVVSGYQWHCTGGSQSFAPATDSQWDVFGTVTAMSSDCTCGTEPEWTSPGSQTIPAHSTTAGPAFTSTGTASAGFPTTSTSFMPLSENVPIDVRWTQSFHAARTAIDSRNDEQECLHTRGEIPAPLQPESDDVEIHCCKEHVSLRFG